jgi:hypothetical protein
MIQEDELANMNGLHVIIVKLTDETGLTNEYSFFVTFESEESEEVEEVEQIEPRSE